MSDLYQTKEWKSLKPTERIYLLPTMEDVRSGASVEPEYESLEYCLKEKGLKISKEKDSLIWLVSKNENLLEDIAKKLKSYSKTKSSYPMSEEEKEYHTSIGKFFGYPDCCIKNFIETSTKGILTGMEWKKKAGKALTEGKYDELFDYALHVPCGLDCKDTLSLAKDIKSCLETYDPEAADTLKKSSRKSIERFAKCTTT